MFFLHKRLTCERLTASKVDDVVLKIYTCIWKACVLNLCQVMSCREWGVSWGCSSPLYKY